MVESLLIYGVASLAAGAARNLTDLDDDYGLSHIAGHAAFEAVAGGVKRLRERFEQFTPDRNHDLMQALERGYLQALLHLVLPWAESLGINPRELLRTGRVPRWAIDAWETLSGGRPESLMGMAAAPDVRKLVDEILERLGEEPEVSDATREELEQAFDRVEEVLGARRRAADVDVDIRAALTRRMLADIGAYWNGALPESLAARVDERGFEFFRNCFFYFLKHKPEVKAVVDAALGVRILDEVRSGFGEMRAGFREMREGFAKLSGAAAARPMALVNVPDLSGSIVGRDREAQVLLEYLDRHRAAAIVAPPFFGKSAILRRMLREVTDGTAITREGLAGIVYLNGALTLPRIFHETGKLTGDADRWTERAELANRSLGEKLDDYWSHLQGLGQVWLILDGFEVNLRSPREATVKDPDTAAWLSSFFERESPHKLLVGSQFAPRIAGVRAVEEIGRALNGGLTEPDSVMLWKDALGGDFDSRDASDPVLLRLSERLRRMPGAIRVAAEYIIQRKGEMTPQRLLENQEFFADFEGGDLERGFRGAIRSLIEVLDADSRRMLDFLSFVPEPVPGEACAVVLEGVRLVEALTTLGRSVMMASAERDIFGTNWYRLHGVVGDLLRGKGVLEEEWIGHCIAEGNRAQRAKRFALAGALQDCGREIAEELVRGGRVDLRENLATALVNKGITLSSQKQFGEAVKCYDWAIEIREELVLGGREDLRENVATALMNKGNALTSQKQFGEAVKCYDRAIGNYQELIRGGREDLRENVATALMNKGITLYSQKQFGEAVKCYDRAIGNYQELIRGGREDLREDVATALVNKGVTLDSQKQFGEAVKCYDRAIGNYQELIRGGREDLRENVATALMNKGITLSSQKQFGEAVKCYDWAIEIREELVLGGREDLREDVATALMNKGNALTSQKQFGEAVKCYDQAIEIREELVQGGREDLRENVATALMNKGIALDSQKQFVEAVKCYDRAIEICEELVLGGREDLREDLATALENKGNALTSQKQFGEAVKCYDRAIGNYQELIRGGREDLREDVATALVNKGVTLDSQKQFGEAVKCYDRAIGNYQEMIRGGREDLRENVATALMNKGIALDSQKQFVEAVKCYDRAIEICEELVLGGREDLREDLATALENKHILVEQQGDLAQALELIRRAAGIRRQLHAEGYGHQKDEFLRSLEWMAQTLDSLGRQEEAAACRAEVREILDGDLSM